MRRNMYAPTALRTMDVEGLAKATVGPDGVFAGMIWVGWPDRPTTHSCRPPAKLRRDVRERISAATLTRPRARPTGARGAGLSRRRLQFVLDNVSKVRKPQVHSGAGH